uniref:Peptidase metallopeptidase domain-containing protein n=1 Tax=viral metagenome TaxID=1070528 RepID=A0A6C0JQI7_9ZZZZ
MYLKSFLYCFFNWFTFLGIQGFVYVPNQPIWYVDYDLILNLSWSIKQYPKLVKDHTIIENITRKAFLIWETEHIIPSFVNLNLTFTKVLIDSNITFIWFNESEIHTDYNHSNEFLAHTFYPYTKYSGEIHIKDDERWNVSEHFMLYVLLHEIGHSLGLKHSNRRESIMYPYYTYAGSGKYQGIIHIKLDLDDKCSLHTLYVRKTNMCLFVWLLSEYVYLRELRQVYLPKSDELKARRLL